MKRRLHSEFQQVQKPFERQSIRKMSHFGSNHIIRTGGTFLSLSLLLSLSVPVCPFLSLGDTEVFTGVHAHCCPSITTHDER